LRIFVTGATGFIGQHVCRHFIDRGDEVVALIRSAAKATRLPAGVATFSGDLATFADAKTVLPPCDVVIHLAGVIAAEKLDDYDATNHRAVQDLVDCLCRQSWKPKRLLLASSLAAMGPSKAAHPWVESDRPEPIEAYGIAKAKAEVVVERAPFPTTSFRPPIVFGPGDEATLTFFKAARSGVGMRVAGPPQELSFVDIRDLVHAITLMAEDSRSESFVYFTSHPAAMNVPTLWRELGRALDKRVLVVPIPRIILFLAMLVATSLAKIFRFKNQLDKKQYDQMVAPAFVCSSEKLKAELGWNPRYGFGETLANAAEGYRQAGRL
jgi:nucleoside-diphosphate-sugar epimerase